MVYSAIPVYDSQSESYQVSMLQSLYNVIKFFESAHVRLRKPFCPFQSDIFPHGPFPQQKEGMALHAKTDHRNGWSESTHGLHHDVYRTEAVCAPCLNQKGL